MFKAGTPQSLSHQLDRGLGAGRPCRRSGPARSRTRSMTPTTAYGSEAHSTVQADAIAQHAAPRRRRCRARAARRRPPRPRRPAWPAASRREQQSQRRFEVAPRHDGRRQPDVDEVGDQRRHRRRRPPARRGSGRRRSASVAATFRPSRFERPHDRLGRDRLAGVHRGADDQHDRRLERLRRCPAARSRLIVRLTPPRISVAAVAQIGHRRRRQRRRGAAARATPAEVSVCISRSSPTSRQSPTTSSVAARRPSAPTITSPGRTSTARPSSDLDRERDRTALEDLGRDVVAGGPLAHAEARPARTAAHRSRRCASGWSGRRLVHARQHQQQREQRRALGHLGDGNVLVRRVRSLTDRPEAVERRRVGARDVAVRGTADRRLRRAGCSSSAAGGLRAASQSSRLRSRALERRAPEAALDLDRDPLLNRLEAVDRPIDRLPRPRSVRTRASTPRSTSGATTFGRRPPSIVPTLTVMPRSWSLSSNRRWIWCEASRMALTPCSGARPAWLALPLMPHREAPDSLAGGLQLARRPERRLHHERARRLLRPAGGCARRTRGCRSPRRC